jgi:PAS domain S-box-containing protein
LVSRSLWTPELEALHGLRPGVFGGNSAACERLVHPDDLATVMQQVQQAYATRQPLDGEWRVIWPDGSTHWLAGRFQAFADATDPVRRLMGVNLDITHRKRAEEAQRVFAAKLQQTQKLESLGVPAGVEMLPRAARQPAGKARREPGGGRACAFVRSSAHSAASQRAPRWSSSAHVRLCWPHVRSISCRPSARDAHRCRIDVQLVQRPVRVGSAAVGIVRPDRMRHACNKR